jgi:hypothetical protein
MDAGAECPWPYAQEQQQQFAVAAESREKARAPKAIELVEVGLDVEPELPNGFDLAVFRKVLEGANRVRTDEGEQLGGTVFLLVADETHVADIGYTLDKIENKGFIADCVCFMTGNIDKKLVKLMKLDGAHIVAAKKGVFLAISCQVEPSGEDMQRRTWRLDEHGTKHNSTLRMSEFGHVGIVRSDDGHLTVFTPLMTAMGKCYRVDPRMEQVLEPGRGESAEQAQAPLHSASHAAHASDGEHAR